MALRLESAKIRKIGGTRRLHNRAILIYEVEFNVEIYKLKYVHILKTNSFEIGIL